MAITKVGILGASGRMGRMLVAEIQSGAYACTLGAAVGREDDASDAFQACDVLIDFTSPEGTLEHAALATLYKKPLVSGVTGLTAVEEAAIQVASKTAPVLHSANMSFGVNLLAAFIEQTAARLGPEDFDIEIVEAHHRHKTDAPSGTALLLGRAAAKGRGVTLDAAMIPARFGQTGPRITGSIGIQAFRGGDVVGDHTVTFAGMGERVEFAHKASDRAIFAKGAIRAALWLRDKPPGLYDMRDVLGLRA